MKTVSLVLTLLAIGLIGYQSPVMAESMQGTIAAIDDSAHTFNVYPNGSWNGQGHTVKVSTAPGVEYRGVEGFHALEVGDYVIVDSSLKSKRGGANVEATAIKRTAVQRDIPDGSTVIVRDNAPDTVVAAAPATVVTTYDANAVSAADTGNANEAVQTAEQTSEQSTQLVTRTESTSVTTAY